MNSNRRLISGYRKVTENSSRSSVQESLESSLAFEGLDVCATSNQTGDPQKTFARICNASIPIYRNVILPVTRTSNESVVAFILQTCAARKLLGGIPRTFATAKRRNTVSMCCCPNGVVWRY